MSFRPFLELKKDVFRRQPARFRPGNRSVVYCQQDSAIDGRHPTTPVVESTRRQVEGFDSSVSDAWDLTAPAQSLDHAFQKLLRMQSLHCRFKMRDSEFRALRENPRTTTLLSLKKAPRGYSSFSRSRGKLLHLQDPAFITDNPELLMTRPTRQLTHLIKSIADRHGASRPLVKSIVEELEAAEVVGVTTHRRPQGIPKLIPIVRERGYHTDQIGTFRDRQYAGFVFYLEPAQKRLVSVLHVFDKFGFHQHSDGWDGAKGCDPKLEPGNAIKALVQSIAGDIRVQLFSVELFGTTFGMIQTHENHVEYLSCGLGFNPPWDGLYDT